MFSYWRSPGAWKLLLWAFLHNCWKQQFLLLHLCIHVSVTVNWTLPTAYWVIMKKVTQLLYYFFLSLTNTWVVTSNALEDLTIFQDAQLYFSFTVLQNIQHYPNITRSFLVRNCSPVVIGLKNAFKAPNTGKSDLNISLGTQRWRKQLELLDLLPSVNTFSLNVHTHTSND